MEEPKPGQTISPHVDEPNKPQTADLSDKSEQASQWQFRAEDNKPSESKQAKATTHQTSTETIEWSASEFIAHKKSVGWYLLLIIITAIVASGVFLLTRDKISTGVIIFAAIVLGIFAARKPRTLNYKLDESGLRIGEKFYSYDLFKSFAVMEEGAFSSILLLPLKRFMPALSLYYDPEDENKIANLLADRLPFEDRKHDAVDGLMRRIRF